MAKHRLDAGGAKAGAHRKAEDKPQTVVVPKRVPGATLPTRPLPMAPGLSVNGQRALDELEGS